MSTDTRQPEMWTAAIARLDAAIAEGRLVRDAWGGIGKDGRQLVCILSALSPEAQAAKDASSCPAELMPSWAARLLVDLSEQGSADAWPSMVIRVRTQVAGLCRLDPGAWHRLLLCWARVNVVELLAHAPAYLLGPIGEVVGHLDRAIAGESASVGVWAPGTWMAALKLSVGRIADAASREDLDEAVTAGVGWAADLTTGDLLAEMGVAFAAEKAAGTAALADGPDAPEARMDRLRRAAWDRMASAYLDAVDAEVQQATPTAGGALAREAVACKGWEWLPGMLGASGTRYDAQDDRGRPYRIESRPVEWPGDPPVTHVYGRRDDLPDLLDEPTKGCVLALARKAWADPYLHIQYSWTWSRWYVYGRHPRLPGLLGGHDTEADALVAALKAAP